MSIAEHILNERFYGAKSQTITDVDIVLEKEYGEHTLVLARVNDALYQLFVDSEGCDRLADHDDLRLSLKSPFAGLISCRAGSAPGCFLKGP